MAVSLAVRATHAQRRVSSAFSSLWDRLGIVASGLCLIDCLVLPLLSTALIGFQSTASWASDLHWFLLPLIGVTGSIAFHHSYRAHRSYLIVALGSAGFALLLAGEILEARSAVRGINFVSLAGSALLISAHARNLLMHAGKGKHAPRHAHGARHLALSGHDCADHAHSPQVP